MSSNPSRTRKYMHETEKWFEAKTRLENRLGLKISTVIARNKTTRSW